MRIDTKWLPIVVLAAGRVAAASTGVLDTINTSTGVLTDVAPLDWPFGAPVNAMEWFGETLVGVIDDGTYGKAGNLATYGETFAIIAPQLSPIVYAVFELPAQVGSQSHVDALATVPVTAGPPLPHGAWVPLQAR